MNNRKYVAYAVVFAVLAVLVVSTVPHLARLRLGPLPRNSTAKVDAHRAWHPAYLSCLCGAGHSLEDFSSSGAPASVQHRIDRPHHYWIHRAGVARTSRRTDSAVFDLRDVRTLHFRHSSGSGQSNASLTLEPSRYYWWVRSFWLPARAHFPSTIGSAKGGFLLVALVAAISFGASAVYWKGEAIASWVERRFSHLAANLGHKIAARVREFRSGLNTIHDPLSLILLIALSILMWFMIIVAYQEVAHSYGIAILNIRRSQVLVLMGASMIGSMVQLPGIGGGSQLATIATLHRIFDFPPELAASCGIMLWLVTFVSVVPVGLLLSHHERLSLRKLSAETGQADEVATVEEAT